MPPRQPIQAFSILELLLVMGILALLASVATMAFNSVRGAGALSKTGQDIAGILEQARAYAMAHNTYVWVGLKNGNADTLTIGVAASTNGESQPANPDAAAGDISQLDRTRNFANTRMVSAPAGTRPAVPEEGQMARSQEAILTFKIGSGSHQVEFNQQVIQFNSRGEAKMKADTLLKTMEIGLQTASSGTIRNPENYVAIQLGGLSGAVVLHRP